MEEFLTIIKSFFETLIDPTKLGALKGFIDFIVNFIQNFALLG